MSTADDIRELRAQVNELNTTVVGGLAKFQAILTEHQASLDKLTAVTLGDSTALVSEVRVINEQLEHGKETFTALSRKLRAVNCKLDDQQAANAKGRWQLRAAITTGILGLASAVVAYFKK